MSYIKCSGCAEIVEIPDELLSELAGRAKIELIEPYYCDACEVAAQAACDYFDNSSICSHCGKEFEDWSDLGCEYCDRRHPGFGTAA